MFIYIPFVSVTYIQVQYGIHNSYNVYTLYIYMYTHTHTHTHTSVILVVVYTFLKLAWAAEPPLCSREPTVLTAGVQQITYTCTTNGTAYYMEFSRFVWGAHVLTCVLEVWCGQQNPLTAQESLQCWQQVCTDMTLPL